MSTDTAKIRSKLAELDGSLDQLESQLEPLFAQSLPETLLALDTIQQAKLQVIIPYVVYDLIFVYLKSRGIDPKTHRVVAELERVRQYFDKIKHAEESEQKRKTGIDKAAAGRFIKHAIAQAKNAQLVDESSDAPPAAGPSSNHERVPVKVTSKMAARVEYERELEELGSDEEEGLEVFNEGVDEEAIDTADGPLEETRFTALDKGKGRVLEEGQTKDEGGASSGRKRPRVDPFAGYENLMVSESTPKIMAHSKSVKLSMPVQVADTSWPESVSASEAREARRTTKKAKLKAEKL